MSKFSLCVITDRKLAGGRSIPEVVEEAIRGGADAIQFRDKEATSRELLEEGLCLRELTREKGVLLIVNDRLDIALAVDADGVHLGQEDLPAFAARRLMGPRKIMGITTSDLTLALKAQEEGADYVGIGSIYPTVTKQLTTPPRGPEFIRAFSGRLSIPFVPLGGISEQNVEDVVKAGARSIAVCSAVVSAPDVAEAARKLKERMMKAVEDQLD
jgi:thiamine-phosphate pyrophosphorylase